MTSGWKVARGVLWILPLVLSAVVLLAAIPWLKTISPPMAILLSAAIVVFGMSYANYLGFRALRTLDEVQKAGAAFAAQWGAPLGQAAFCLLLVLPPFQNFMAAVVGNFAAGPGTPLDAPVVVVTLTLGFLALVVLQAIGTVVVQAIWWTAKR